MVAVVSGGAVTHAVLLVAQRVKIVSYPELVKVLTLNKFSQR